MTYRRPHIYFKRGKWRIRPMGVPYYALHHLNWAHARDYCRLLNARRAT